MSDETILETFELGFPWRTFDPFLFCVHHLDHYPKGNETMGPARSLEGRNLGMDFELKDGFRMYHGDVVPGFPRHPHRGFETITLARQGFIDHSDSLGATARFGEGDCQWMTAGKGIVHAEMFPLVHTDRDNPGELFQIWLNLPREDKMVDPYFRMLWSHDIPKLRMRQGQVPSRETAGGAVLSEGEARVAVVAGELQGHTPAKPPPNSWASRPDTGVAVWTIELAAHAHLELPPAPQDLTRTLYFFAGGGLRLNGQAIAKHCGMRVDASKSIAIESDDEALELLMLQGKPIDEVVVQHGPFVMNAPAEIKQAIVDYHQTEFGGWPWPSDGPVHPRDAGPFAVHADGRKELKP